VEEQQVGFEVTVTYLYPVFFAHEKKIPARIVGRMCVNGVTGGATN
jgi:hypothetical protein